MAWLSKITDKAKRALNSRDQKAASVLTDEAQEQEAELESKVNPS